MNTTAKRVCSSTGCGTLIPPGTRSGRCPACERQRDQARGSSTARGYGYQHKILSVAERQAAIGTDCHLCGQVMEAGQQLALDHTEDRTGYRGVTHLSCNASDGATRGNQLR